MQVAGEGKAYVSVENIPSLVKTLVGGSDTCGSPSQQNPSKVLLVFCGALLFFFISFLILSSLFQLCTPLGTEVTYCYELTAVGSDLYDVKVDALFNEPFLLIVLPPSCKNNTILTIQY